MILIDVSEDLVKKGLSRIDQSLGRIAKKQFPDETAQKKFVKDSLDNIKTSVDGASAVKEVDLVIEAIIENMDKKKELWKLVDGNAGKQTLFASNTSSLSITEQARATKRADKFGGLHFFNPVPVMKLVEVIKTNQTSETTHNSLFAFAKAIGKVPITCKDTPGFVVNRLLVPYMMEAIR